MRSLDARPGRVSRPELLGRRGRTGRSHPRPCQDPADGDAGPGLAAASLEPLVVQSGGDLPEATARGDQLGGQRGDVAGEPVGPGFPHGGSPRMALGAGVVGQVAAPGVGSPSPLESST